MREPPILQREDAMGRQAAQDAMKRGSIGAGLRGQYSSWLWFVSQCAAMLASATTCMQRDAQYAVDNSMTVSAGFLSPMASPFLFVCPDWHHAIRWARDTGIDCMNQGSAPSASRTPRRLSQEIEGLLEALGERPVTLREVISVTKSRAYTLLLILLSLPFCLPVPVPGLSTALGAIIAIIGLRLSMRAEPWLPARLLDAPVASARVAQILRASLKVVRGLEVLLRPRLCFLVDFAVLHHLYGAMIFVCGALLMLPLPIPFSNLLPALAVIFLAAALIERDGYFIIAGSLMFIFTLAFFAGMFVGSAALVAWMRDWIGSGYDPQETLPNDFPLLPDIPVPDVEPPRR